MWSLDGSCSRSMLLRVGAARMALAAFSPTAAFSQVAAPSQGARADPQLTDKLLAGLRRIVSELSNLGSSDPVLARLLPGLVTELDNRLVRLSPNAYAAGGTASAPRIVIDLTYLHRIWMAADLAAAIRLDYARSAVSAYATNFGQRVGQAKSVGVAPPFIDFSVQRAGLDPLLTGFLSDVAREVSDCATAWVVLHEIGHHALNHLAYPSDSNAQQRARETEADAFATRKFFQLGYAPEPLRMALIAFSLQDRIYAMGGMLPPEVATSHPSWGSRLISFEALALDRQVPSFPMHAIRMWMEDDTGKVFPVTFAFTSDPAEDAVIGMVQGPEGPGICAVVRSGSSVTIYMRPAAGPRQMAVLEPTTRFFLVGKVTYFLLSGARTVQGNAFHVSIATRLPVSPGIPGIGASATMKAFNLKVLPSAQASQVNALQNRSQRAQTLTYIDYAQGLTSPAQYAARSGSLAQAHERAVSVALGDGAYADYKRLLDKHIARNLMTGAVQARLRTFGR